MTTLRFPIPRLKALAPLLLLASGMVAAKAAPAANHFDGSWSVEATGSEGACPGPYHYPIVIRNGRVDDAGGNDVDASGRAEADGDITGTIRQGLAVISVSGRLAGSAGSGQWTLSGLGSCTGRWTARRVG